MTDLWKEAVALARSTAVQLRKKKKPVQEYAPDEGQKINGWVLHRYFDDSHRDRRFSGAVGDYEEEWGEHDLVLGADGLIYEWRLHNTEYGSARRGGARTETTRTLQKLSRKGVMALGPGRPFAVVTEMLQRLYYS